MVPNRGDSCNIFDFFPRGDSYLLLGMYDNMPTRLHYFWKLPWEAGGTIIRHHRVLLDLEGPLHLTQSTIQYAIHYAVHPRVAE